LNKLLQAEELRGQQAKQVFEQVGELFDKGEVGVLELNKAKVSWMQKQFKLVQLGNEKWGLALLLQSLNGGQELTFDQLDYLSNLELAPEDSIWQDKLLADPMLKKLGIQKDVAIQQVKLSKNKLLPDLVVGFNHQGVPGSEYSGLYAGVSLPLWNTRSKSKAAKINSEYQQVFVSAKLLSASLAFAQQYKDYKSLLGKFKEYQSTMDGISSDKLLLEAYGLGEISFMEYYMELQCYQQAYDSMLQMEKQLHLLKSGIMGYKL